MSNNNITAYKINKDVGISISLVTYYSKGERQPTIDNLVKLADYFNVSVDYLLGREENKKSPAVETGDKELDNLFAKIKILIPKARQRIIDQVEDMMCNPENLVAAQKIEKRA
jgi:transcriptional regulator with XRE-family HTH domain